MMTQKKVQHLVTDSGAFILNCPLQVNYNLLKLKKFYFIP